MAEETTEQHESAGTPESIPEPVIGQKNDKPKPAARSRSGLLLVIVLLLLVIGLAIAGFYFLSQLRDKQEGLGGEVKTELSRQIKDYQAQLTAIQTQIAALQSEIAGKEEHFNKSLADFSDLNSQKLDATRKDLGDKVSQVQRQLGKTRGDWLLADAEYLLSVANERLHLVGDVNTTREALVAADQRLRESGDTGVIVIREQIAKEISLLKDIKVADVVGIYAALQTLGNDVSKLTLLLPYSGKPLTAPEEVSSSSPVSEDTNDTLNALIHDLEGVVTIKRSSHPIKEILSEEQAEFIREQLKIKLETVKIALVQQNDTLYQAGLTDIKAWTEKHFAKSDSTELFVAELSKLQSIKLRSQFPDISLSLKLLRDVSKLRVETDKALEISTEIPAEQRSDGKAQQPGSVEPPKSTVTVPLDSTQAPQAPANPE